MKNRFLKFELNEASLVDFLCRCLPQPKMFTSGKHNITVLYKLFGLSKFPTQIGEKRLYTFLSNVISLWRN